MASRPGLAQAEAVDPVGHPPQIEGIQLSYAQRKSSEGPLSSALDHTFNTRDMENDDDLGVPNDPESASDIGERRCFSILLAFVVITYCNRPGESCHRRIRVHATIITR